MEMSADTSIPADPTVKNFSYTLVDGEVYFRENSRMVRPELNDTAKERVIGLVELKNCVHALMDFQLEEYGDDAIRNQQIKLNELYDGFTAKYGLINSRSNSLAFSEDSAYYLLCSLENIDENGELASKADMFTKRTIKQHRVATSVDTASEALALSIAEKVGIDMAYMEQLTGLSFERIVSDLQGVIFKNPNGYTDEKLGWETADEYLSGNVRQKLNTAIAANEVTRGGFAANVKALEAAQPKDLDASEIEVRLGATWIDKKYIQRFMYELLDTPKRLRNGIEVKFANYTAEWSITGKNNVSYDDVAAYVIWYKNSYSESHHKKHHKKRER